MPPYFYSHTLYFYQFVLLHWYILILNTELTYTYILSPQFIQPYSEGQIYYIKYVWNILLGSYIIVITIRIKSKILFKKLITCSSLKLTVMLWSTSNTKNNVFFFRTTAFTEGKTIFWEMKYEVKYPWPLLQINFWLTYTEHCGIQVSWTKSATNCWDSMSWLDSPNPSSLWRKQTD